jgi:hypothetical protein
MTFNAEQLLAEAERTTGLSDWGGDIYFEDSFRKLFAAMVASLHADAQLHEQGLRGAEVRLRAIATARLQFIDDRKKWPEIAGETIEKPLFILGLPRAGSSFLQELIAQDSANRSAQTWEMIFPSPPPEPTSYDTDPRILRCEQLLEAMGLLRPEVTSLHPWGARQPEECHTMMELMCLGDTLPGLWRLSGYNKVRAAVDPREGYRLHRMTLQNLQHRYRGERWVLKSPGHVFYLDHLLAVYPDAQIIQTHRDPAKVMPSVAALLAAMRRGNSSAPLKEDRIALGNLRAFAEGLDRAIEFRRQPGVEEHFYDVHFRDLIADPLATVRAIYRRFSLSLSDEAVEQMQTWLASDDSHSAKAKFTLNQFGLTAAQIDESFEKYLDHYNIELERGQTSPNTRNTMP